MPRLFAEIDDLCAWHTAEALTGARGHRRKNGWRTSLASGIGPCRKILWRPHTLGRHSLPYAMTIPQDTDQVMQLEGNDPILDEFSPRDYPLILIALIRKMNTQAIDGLVSPYGLNTNCLLYTSPSPRDGLLSRMPSSA